MNKINSLGARIAFAMMSVITLGVLVLGIIFFFTYDHMEHKLLEMLDSYASQSLDSNKLASSNRNIETILNNKKLYVSFSSEDIVPERFRKLKAGFYHDIEYQDRDYHAAVKEINGIKKYLVFDITEIETQEHVLEKVIFISTLSVIILALWVTYWLSRKVIRPVREFAEEVGNLDPNVRNVCFAEKYNDVEVGIIAQSFDRYMARLDGFVEREQSFTSTASHELRTPLSVISTSIELLENDNNLQPNNKKYIQLIKKNANEMANLISSLLFLARENVPQNYNPVELTDIAKLTQTIIDTHSSTVNKDIKLTLSIDQPMSVNAPRSHVQIIINNLLNNAIRHTQQGEIKIKLYQDKLEVIDSGSGIDESTLNNAFERGFKGKDSSGYGFGLYICKQICERYGWDISILPNSDIGTTASVSF